MYRACNVGITLRVMRVLTRSVGSTLAIVVALCAAPLAFGQDDPAELARKDENDPKLIHWKWTQELKLPEKSAGPFLALPIAPAVFGRVQKDPNDKMQGEFRDFKMQEEFGGQPPFDPRDRAPGDLRDLRIADTTGKHVPYVLRVMRKDTRQTNLRFSKVDDGWSDKSRTYQWTLELADADAKGPGHNEIEIHTTGRDFRRRVVVEGSDTKTFDDPRRIVDKKIAYYEVEGKIVEVDRFHYDLKQSRHLRVRVHADPTLEKDKPTITSVVVRQSFVEPGEFHTEPVKLNFQGGTRGDGGAPGTAWLIEFPSRMPVEKLTFEVKGPPSDRPFRLETVNPREPRMYIGISDWTWRKDGERLLLDILLQQEVIAQTMRFIVTDNANEPFKFENAAATGCVRKVFIEKIDAEKFTAPLKLYVGNTNVGPANYVLAQKLPAHFDSAPALIEAGALKLNPAYEPPPKTLHERAPWLVYVVLGIACAALLAILGLLARQAISRHDALAAEVKAA